MILDVAWTKGAREIYQPIDAPELGSKWITVRRCTNDSTRSSAARTGCPSASTRSFIAKECAVRGGKVTSRQLTAVAELARPASRVVTVAPDHAQIDWLLLGITAPSPDEPDGVGAVGLKRGSSSAN
jgi:hypothetical protein